MASLTKNRYKPAMCSFQTKSITEIKKSINMVQVIKIILRVIALPFFSAIALIHTLFLWLLFSYNFVKHGGEAVAYTKKFKGTTMADTLLKVEELVNRETKE
jgi:hypothetical protein